MRLHIFTILVVILRCMSTESPEEYYDDEDVEDVESNDSRILPSEENQSSPDVPLLQHDGSSWNNNESPLISHESSSSPGNQPNIQPWIRGWPLWLNQGPPMVPSLEGNWASWANQESIPTLGQTIAIVKTLLNNAPWLNTLPHWMNQLTGDRSSSVGQSRSTSLWKSDCQKPGCKAYLGNQPAKDEGSVKISLPLGPEQQPWEGKVPTWINSHQRPKNDTDPASTSQDTWSKTPMGWAMKPFENNEILIQNIKGFFKRSPQFFQKLHNRFLDWHNNVIKSIDEMPFWFEFIHRRFVENHNKFKKEFL